MGFNPLNWAGDVWQWAFGTENPAEPAHVAEPVLFLCACCGCRERPSAVGGKFCDDCLARDGGPIDRSDPASTISGTGGLAIPESVLPRARAWLNDGVRQDKLKVYSDRAQISAYMKQFYDGLSPDERKLIKDDLLAAHFPGTKTFDMLVAWAAARLHIRFTELAEVAMWGPRMQRVGGGLPTLGKRH